ncbi:MAG: GyrI-like domain-containing protein [Chitinophagales bacterium]
MKNVELEAFNIIGISVRTTNENNQAGIDIPVLWERFMSKGILAKIPNKIDDSIYCIYTEYEGDYTQPYTTVLGCRVKKMEDVPKGLVSFSFEGGSYGQFTTKGDLTKGLVYGEWTKIWGMDLKRAYTADFEVYGEKAENPTDAEVDIFIAL